MNPLVLQSKDDLEFIKGKTLSFDGQFALMAILFLLPSLDNQIILGPYTHFFLGFYALEILKYK